MAWQQKTVDLLGDILRFSIRGALLLNCIIIALGSCYLTARLVLHTLQFLNRLLFAKPW